MADCDSSLGHMDGKERLLLVAGASSDYREEA